MLLQETVSFLRPQQNPRRLRQAALVVNSTGALAARAVSVSVLHYQNNQIETMSVPQTRHAALYRALEAPATMAPATLQHALRQEESAAQIRALRQLKRPRGALAAARAVSPELVQFLRLQRNPLRLRQAACHLRCQVMLRQIPLHQHRATNHPRCQAMSHQELRAINQATVHLKCQATLRQIPPRRHQATFHP